MNDILVDSNVLLDLMTEDPRWYTWSATALGRIPEGTRLIINPIIYAEVSIRYTRIEDLDLALGTDFFEREPIPFAAAFLAGKCFRSYRQRGGIRASTLPDFFIGAHAAVAGHTLLTRDAARYRTYFPRLTLIAPD